MYRGPFYFPQKYRLTTDIVGITLHFAMSKKPRPLEMMAVRVSRQLRESIKAAADRDYMPVSVWIRIVLRNAANGKDKKNGQ